MIIKKYKANTNVSINVVLPSKKNLHISFIPLSDGSSVFQTDNEDIQRAIESHYNFGRLFRLVEASGVKTPAKKNSVKAASPAPAPVPTETKKEPVETEVPTAGEAVVEETVQEGTTKTTVVETAADEVAPETAGEDNGFRKVTVSDIAAAKDYLADTLGISRTSMRSTKAILQKAAENGIEFVGL